MPSSLSDYTARYRSLRAKVEADLTLSGTYTDYTTNLDNYTWYSVASDNITGIIDSTFDGELNFINPSVNWSKKGIPVRASIQITNDNWVTNYNTQLFVGSTNRQKTVPVRKVKIKASTLNNDFLDRKVTRQVFLNQDIATIMTSLLTQVGVSAGNISLPATGIVLEVYPVSDNFNIKYYIEDLAKASYQLVGFGRDGVFRATSLFKLSFAGGSITPEATFDLGHVQDFGESEVYGKYYINSFKVSGTQLENIPSTYYYTNENISGQELKANANLYYRIDTTNIIPITLSIPIAGWNNGGIGTPVLSSRFYFSTADDGSGTNANNVVSCISSSVVDDGTGKDVVLLVFNNSSGASVYLKKIALYGDAVRIVGQLEDKRRFDSKIINDGEEIYHEISSIAIQTATVLGNVANLLQLNFTNYADIYQLNVRGRPNLKVGSTVQFVDRVGTTHTGVILEIDEETSIDKGYVQKLIIKKLRTDLSFFVWGTTTWGSSTEVWF